ncbi:methionine ABC transporter ATP-binding protein [Basilea psittacipulmonis]|uniref:Cell division ATP-binding protein FtsE n=1 Tax=Basilea psittacipulmonis DSM 24701 TaxID=1072685 RepID=A0A077DET4_9BURK|nr:ATP-binding cassette domain-containing protein [Basilea psittacipulmonis]AIL33350.1 methionine ABC transporter ATP-binding protein [Basilea psittacipulmonis DSM 24701]
MIILKNIHKTYHAKNMTVKALKGIDLSIKKGCVFGIIGRSGAGKSTLIRMINMLERPDEGAAVLIDDKDLCGLNDAELRQERHHIGMVFQHFNLLSSRTVLENVCFPLRLMGVSKEEQLTRAKELLDLVGLTGLEHKYPGELSGGQQQRVGIARALASRPKLLLCDEATSALDPETTQSILDLLADINKKLNITIVLITHSMNVIRAICDEVAVIDGGLIVEQGSVMDVFLAPKHATTKALLGESNLLGEDWQRLVTTGLVVRLTYRGEETTQPVISLITKRLGIAVSILQGTIGQIKGIPYGQVVVSINANETDIPKLKALFFEHQVSFEILQNVRQ